MYKLVETTARFGRVSVGFREGAGHTGEQVEAMQQITEQRDGNDIDEKEQSGTGVVARSW